jgi:chromate reductase, NAD(P)H dehydrogenase (quinone)
MKILAFSTSGSSTSINKQLLLNVLNNFSSSDIELADLNDYELPIYNSDKEIKDGIPAKTYEFQERIDQADLIIMAMAEHNGAYTVLFKNLFDWMTRIPERKTFPDKKMFLVSTSPGPMGGKVSLDIAAKRFPYHGAQIVGTFSLPSYYQNFKEGEGIIDQGLKDELHKIVQIVKQ